MEISCADLHVLCKTMERKEERRRGNGQRGWDASLLRNYASSRARIEKQFRMQWLLRVDRSELFSHRHLTHPSVMGPTTLQWSPVTWGICSLIP